MNSAAQPADQGLNREYWTEAPHIGDVRTASMPKPGPSDVLIRTLMSGISSGTESLVHRGEVPEQIESLMRAPNQLGDLPFPVSHGYLNVGIVEQGPADVVGERVFTLSGHREYIVCDVTACHRVPDGIPTSRALLAGIAEVGLNAIWEANMSLGDRVAVTGGGLVGLTTALLAAKTSPQRLELIEPNDRRRAQAQAAGIDARSPTDASFDCDIVIHTSATAAGLNRSLEILGDDGQLIELSWFGNTTPEVTLGADFHARRLRIIGSQVGEVASSRRARRTRSQRLSTALNMLDPRFDTIPTSTTPLSQLPQTMSDIATSAPWTQEYLLHMVSYEDSLSHTTENS